MGKGLIALCLDARVEGSRLSKTYLVSRMLVGSAPFCGGSRRTPRGVLK